MKNVGIRASESESVAIHFWSVLLNVIEVDFFFNPSGYFF